jgi:hypothetical protein
VLPIYVQVAAVFSASAGDEVGDVALNHGGRERT